MFSFISLNCLEYDSYEVSCDVRNVESFNFVLFLQCWAILGHLHFCAVKNLAGLPPQVLKGYR